MLEESRSSMFIEILAMDVGNLYYMFDPNIFVSCKRLYTSFSEFVKRSNERYPALEQLKLFAIPPFLYDKDLRRETIVINLLNFPKYYDYYMKQPPAILLMLIRLNARNVGLTPSIKKILGVQSCTGRTFMCSANCERCLNGGV